MTDSTHWGSGLPHICACSIFSHSSCFYGKEGLGAPQKDPLGWTLTNAYPPTFFNQGGAASASGKICCVYTFLRRREIVVCPSVCCLSCLPAGTGNPGPFTYAWAHICMCPPFLYARTHFSPTLAEKIDK